MPFRRTEAEELHAAVVAARAAVREKQHVASVLAQSRTGLAALDERIAALEETHRREAREYARIASEGVTALFHALVGDVQQKRNEERWEMLAVAVRLDESRAERKLRREEIAALEARLAALGDADELWEAALARREAWLRAHDDEAARSLAAIADEKGVLVAEARELQEAADAALAAAQPFAQLKATLESAGAWGMLDVASTGNASHAAGLAKHVLLDGARKQLPEAQQRLDRLRSECADLGMTVAAPGVPLDRSGWALDVFVDNVLTDLATSHGIQKSHRAVKETLDAIETVQRQLGARAARGDQRREALHAEWLRILGG